MLYISLLFRRQRLNRLYPHRFHCRNQSGERAEDKKHSHYPKSLLRQELELRGRNLVGGHMLSDTQRDCGESYSGGAGDERQRHSLRQNLHYDVAGLCPERAPYADFLCTLPHNHPHYISDADYSGYQSGESDKPGK